MKTLFLDEGMEGWTRKFIARNAWRVGGLYEFDDLLSEAWLVLDKVSRKYTDVSDKHLMALYQRSLYNRFHDLAWENSRKSFVEFGYSTDSQDESSFDRLEAPPEITDSEMLAKVIDVGGVVAECYIAVIEGKISADSGRETHNQRFDRALELPAGTNSARQFRDFLRDSSRDNTDNVCLQRTDQRRPK